MFLSSDSLLQRAAPPFHLIEYADKVTIWTTVRCYLPGSVKKLHSSLINKLYVYERYVDDKVCITEQQSTGHVLLRAPKLGSEVENSVTFWGMFLPRRESGSFRRMIREDPNCSK